MAFLKSKGSILDIITQYFNENDWNFSQMEGKPILTMGVTGKNGSWKCFAQARNEDERFIYYSVLAMNVPENKRTVAAEYLTRANYGLILGNFEMDFSDGEVRYKTSIDVEGGELTSTMIGNVVKANLSTFDRYLTGLMSVIYSDASPEKAIAEAES